MPVILVEGIGKIEFPETMSPDEIKRAIETDIIPRGSKSRQSGREEGSGIQGALTALNGLTFGFGDEVAGAAKGAYNAVTGGSFDEGYRDTRDYVRGAVEQFRKDQPILAPVADISGSLLQAPLAAGGMAARGVASAAKPVMSVLERVLAAAGIGAATGAAQGAGEAETMADVPEKAGIGAALGGALGAGASGAGAVVRGVRDQIAPRFSGAAAHDLALRRLGLALVRDEKTGEQVIRRMEKLGPEATIADAGGENARNLLDTIATLPGKTQNQVEGLIRQRQVGRAGRMDAIPDSLGGATSGDKVLQELQATKEQLSAPLYDAVNRATVLQTPKLADLAERPIIKAAIEQARTNVANRGQDAAERFVQDEMATGQTPLRFWDDVKKGLDDVIGGIKRGTSNSSGSTLRSAVDVKRELLAELDKLSIDPATGKSVYKEARDAFAGPAALQSAIEDGRSALTMSPPDIKRALDRMSVSEQEAFRLGAADAYRDKIGTRAGQTNLLNAPFDRNTRQQMSAIFDGQRGYREAMSTLLGEAELKKLERVGRGSQTAGREARMEDLNAGVLDDAANAAKSAVGGNVLGVVSAARSLGSRLGTPESVRDEIGRLLTLRGVPAQEQLQAMEAIIRSMRMGNSQAAAIQGVLGGSLINQ